MSIVVSPVELAVRPLGGGGVAVGVAVGVPVDVAGGVVGGGVGVVTGQSGIVTVREEEKLQTSA